MVATAVVIGTAVEADSVAAVAGVELAAAEALVAVTDPTTMAEEAVEGAATIMEVAMAEAVQGVGVVAAEEAVDLIAAMAVVLCSLAAVAEEEEEVEGDRTMEDMGRSLEAAAIAVAAEVSPAVSSGTAATATWPPEGAVEVRRENDSAVDSAPR